MTDYLTVIECLTVIVKCLIVILECLTVILQCVTVMECLIVISLVLPDPISPHGAYRLEIISACSERVW